MKPEKNASQLLGEYENLEYVQPSVEWEQRLLKRIDASRFENKNKYQGLKFVVVTACFLLINTIYFLRQSDHEVSKSTQRYNAMQYISDELLINETALK